MEYIVSIAVFAFSIFFAYFLVKAKLSFAKKVVINLLVLLVCGCITFATGLKETSFLIYILLLLLTFGGILMRVITPFVLNFIGIVLSKIQKEPYTMLNYEEFMQSGSRMYFCVLTFSTLKVLLYIALGASFFGVI